MFRTIFVLVFGLFSIWCDAGLLGGQFSDDEKPNLIVIMADDLGYSDVGFNGCVDIPTPHIDSIAANGVRCTSGYVAYAVCGPSRAGFIICNHKELQNFGFRIPTEPTV